MTFPERIRAMNGWVKVLSVCAPMTIGGLVGYGKLQAQSADEQTARIDATKAIQRELNLVHAQLDRVESNQREILLIIGRYSR